MTDDVSGLAFLQGGGEIGALMRARQWTSSGLGSPRGWPQCLRSVVELVLQSKFPMFVAWGENLLLLYNDAYSEILGSKHPRALGAPFYDIWSEIWPDISPLIDAAMRGEATYREDLPLVMNRKGFAEQTWFTFGCSPVRDEGGHVAGIYCAVTETTHEEKLRQALAATGLGAFIWHVEEDVWEADERMMALFGLRPEGERTLKDALATLIHADDRDRYARAVARACDPNGPGELREDIRILLPGGDVRWIAINGQTAFAGEPRRASSVAGTAIDVTQRKLAEEALRDGEQRLEQELADARTLQAVSTRLIHEQRPDALYDDMLDAAIQLMRSDAATIQVHDAEQNALRLRATKNLSPQALAYEAVVTAESPAASGQALKAQTRVAIEDVETCAPLSGSRELGDYRREGLRAVQATPLFSRSGRLLGMMSTCRRAPHHYSKREFRFFDVLARQAADLIERLEAEAALKNSEEQLRLATDAADVGLWDVDHVTDTLFWPPRVKAMFGISPNVPVSMADFYAGLHPDDREFVSAEYAAAANPAIRSVYDVEYRTVGKEDGIIRWVAAKGRGVFDDEGRCIRVIGTAIDITERRSAQEQLRELNETLEQRVATAVAERNILADIVEGTDAFVQIADLDYRLLAINKAAADAFELTLGVRPAVGESLLNLLAGQPEQLARVKRVWGRALAGEEFTEIVEVGSPSPEQRFYEMKFNVLRDHNGKTIGAYQFAHDVTEGLRNEARLREADAVLRHAQKMEAVGQLTGGVAHDFNNLLMAVSAGLRLMEQPLDEVKRERALAGMRRAVERGASLTRQLLAFSRRRPLASEPINLASQVSGMRDFIDRSLGGDVQIMMGLPPDIWTIEADAGELELAVLNLCVNARDAMPKGGVIMIDARNVTEEGESGGREVVELCVGDTGAGMSDEVLARACEPFFTTKEIGKGSGLGLAQVYAFVTSSGGALAIESKPGMGTTVRLRFPRSNKSSAPRAERDDPRPPPRGEDELAGHVLLVEDDREVAILSREMLESVGLEVTHAASADAALGALEHGRRIDVVFSDIMMPGGMNGVELAREIRRRHPELPVILATGYAEGVREAEADGFLVLTKPYQLETLSDVLTRQLR